MREIPHLPKASAQVLLELRARSGLSQEKLAELAGVSRSYITYLEKGTTLPGLRATLVLAEAMGVTGVELMERIEKKLKELSAHSPV